VAAGRVRIVADDLTGAADAAAPFAACGLRTVVLLPGAPPDASAEVCARSAGSRDLDESAAAAAVAQACRALGAPGPGDVALHKVDSTLRGHLRAELAAALAAWALPRAVVAPAFPSQGRTTRGGVQFAHGVPVDRPSADGGPWAVTADLRALLAGLPCAVADAETDADLDALVARHAGQRVLWVGSGGLAAALARARGGRRRPLGAGAGRGPVLTVVGSRHPRSRAQAVALAEAVRAAVGTWPLGPAEVARLRRDLADGRDVVLRLPEREDPGALAGVAAVAAELAAERAVPLLLTGGATAAAVLGRLGVEALEVLGEALPGVPVARARPDGRLVATKAGGFGGPEALAVARGALAACAEPGGRPRLLLFDVDGTLMEGGGSGGLAMARAVEALWGRPVDPRAVPTAGRTDPGILRDLAALAGVPLGPEEAVRLAARYLEELPRALAERGARLLPGVRRLLLRLAADGRCRLALGTGNLEAGAALKLRYLGLEGLFAAGGFGDRALDRPTLLREALDRASERFGVPFRPAEAVVVGDAVADVVGARALGMRVLAVATGRTLAADLAAAGPDALVPDLTDTDRVAAWLLAG
jgi:uncharacterized protein YgbK (DUF1537 family)/phosphoglycolate phosphatase-like HAD superfamily hydrolase